MDTSLSVETGTERGPLAFRLLAGAHLWGGLTFLRLASRVAQNRIPGGFVETHRWVNYVLWALIAYELGFLFYFRRLLRPGLKKGGGDREFKELVIAYSICQFVGMAPFFLMMFGGSLVQYYICAGISVPFFLLWTWEYRRRF